MCRVCAGVRCARPSLAGSGRSAPSASAPSGPARSCPAATQIARRRFASSRSDGTLRSQGDGAIAFAAPQLEKTPVAPRPWLSVVLPVRDEIGALPGLTSELEKVLDQVAAPWELVFADDGSRDGSLEWALAKSARDPRCRVVSLGAHRGQASALGAGFQAARGDVIATLDADGQNDPADLPRLLALLADDTDVVCGVRAERHDAAHRRLASKVANAVRNRLTGESIVDVGCSLRVMRARFARCVRLERGLHRFLPTLLRLEGARVVQTEVGHRAREAGRSKYGIVDRLPEALRDLWTVRRLHVAARRRHGPGSRAT